MIMMWIRDLRDRRARRQQAERQLDAINSAVLRAIRARVPLDKLAAGIDAVTDQWLAAHEFEFAHREETK